MARKTNYAHPLKHYAEQLKCSLKSIQRYAKDHAPLDGDMSEYLARKKRTGGRKPGATPLANSGNRLGSHGSQNSGPEAKGAAEALKRLEVAESQLYQRFKDALNSGDPDAIGNARSDWLATSESLRKYDLAVEQSRRDSGELIPRQLAENSIRMAAVWLRLSFMAFVESEGKGILELVELRDGQPFVDARRFADRCYKGMRTAVDVQMRNSVRAQCQLPAWGVAIIKDEWRVKDAAS